MFVIDTGEDSDLEKSIASLSLNKVTNRTLEMKISFDDPFAISSNILEPDSLKITIILPQVIIDAETYLELDQSELNREVVLVPQYTEDYFMEWVDIAEKAATIGAVASIIEIIICFVTGKAL